MNTEHNTAQIYIAALGLVTMILGLVDILVWIGFTGGIEFGIMEIAGDDFFRWAWGGLVVFLGGALMLYGCRNVGNIQEFSKVLLGAVLVWIIAACDIFAMICENIPAGEEAPEFLNSFAGFVGGFAPPYAPAVILLPFTLVIAYFFYAWGFADES